MTLVKPIYQFFQDVTNPVKSLLTKPATWNSGNRSYQSMLRSKPRGGDGGSAAKTDWCRGGGNYTINNYSSLVQSNTIFNTFTTTFNPVRPQPLFYKTYVPLIIPPHKLPTDIDNQTSTKTPVGTSINIGNTLDDYGVLKHDPDSLQIVGLFRELNTNDWASRFEAAQQTNLQILVDRRKHEIDPKNNPKRDQADQLQHNGFLIFPENLDGFSGNLGILAGLETISIMAQSYRDMANLANFLPSNELPIRYIPASVDLPGPMELIDNSALRLEAKDPQTLLGFSLLDQDWEDISIEDLIKHYGEEQYKPEQQPQNTGLFSYNTTPPNNIKRVNNFGEYITHLIASLFFRSGFHRFPAKVPESLVIDTKKHSSILKQNNQPSIFIDDALEYQEYLLRNLDALFGQFPIEIISKDEKGNKQTVDIYNIAEGLAELVTMGIQNQNINDALLNINCKQTIELLKIMNTAISSENYARANASYLGYKGKETVETLKIGFTPKAKTLKEFVTPSEQKTTAWAIKEDSTLAEILQVILFNSNVSKAAVSNPLKDLDSFLTGDVIRERRKEDEKHYDDKWNELMDEYSVANAGRGTLNKTKRFPKAKIKDISRNPNQTP